MIWNRYLEDEKKICVIITARPSYSRIKTALKSINDHDKLGATAYSRG